MAGRVDDDLEVEAGGSWVKGSFCRRGRVTVCNPKTREPSFAISPRTRGKRDDLFIRGVLTPLSRRVRRAGRSERGAVRAADPTPTLPTRIAPAFHPRAAIDGAADDPSGP